MNYTVQDIFDSAIRLIDANLDGTFGEVGKDAVEVAASVVDAAKVPVGGVVVSFVTTGGTLSATNVGNYTATAAATAAETRLRRIQDVGGQITVEGWVAVGRRAELHAQGGILGHRKQKAGLALTRSASDDQQI